MKATSHLLQFNNRVFRLHQAEDDLEQRGAAACQRCAFKDERDWCDVGQHSCSGVMPFDDGIWIEEPNWPASLTTYETRIRDATPEETAAMLARFAEEAAPLMAELTESKPTNPKDVIGVRKVAMSCLPANVLLKMALGMMDGAGKYGRHNYRVAGVRSSVYYDATMGHLMDYWEGEDIDPDSGLEHLVKAMSSLAVWVDALDQGMCTDDRPPRSRVLKRHLNHLAADILDKHAGKNPRHYTIEDTK